MRRRFCVLVGILVTATATFAQFQLADDPDRGTLTVQDNTSPVLSLRYGDQLPDGIDQKYIRTCYIHPLWSPGGEILTEDFPEDHPHHHGVFWAWPVVKVRDQETQNWHPHKPSLRQHFVKWRQKTADDSGATITMESHWLLAEKDVVATEEVSLVVHPVKNSSRDIDLKITIEAVGGPLTLQGTHEGKKGYGGFCWRASPAFQNSTITTEDGISTKDFVNRDQWWLDLSTSMTGMAIFPAADHPVVPPKWMARNSYAGFVNVSWPSLEPVILKPGEPVTLRYRLHIHEGRQARDQLESLFRAYVTGYGHPLTKS